ncbi:MAG TPA: hypothetical protein VI815_02475 [Candidatus Nanoarchaeia archaeon]|nr:hypothetical protein [Candidatus Nanoarchaeia archaeon]
MRKRKPLGIYGMCIGKNTCIGTKPKKVIVVYWRENKQKKTKKFYYHVYAKPLGTYVRSDIYSVSKKALRFRNSLSYYKLKFSHITQKQLFTAIDSLNWRFDI